MVETQFGDLFKPEVRSAGRKLYAQEKVAIANASDTGITTYVRVSPAFKVNLLAESVASNTFTAECACPVARKGRFCKHLWASLLLTEIKHPDFLATKTHLDLLLSQGAKETAAPSSSPSLAPPSYQETANKRASEYRKAQYQKQKQKIKEKKGSAKTNPPSPPRFSSEIEQALRYFDQNGFPMPEGPSAEILAEAKRKLSRIFHPDKGGTHDESVELNQNCETLQVFFRL